MNENHYDEPPEFMAKGLVSAELMDMETYDGIYRALDCQNFHEKVGFLRVKKETGAFENQKGGSVL